MLNRRGWTWCAGRTVVVGTLAVLLLSASALHASVLGLPAVEVRLEKTGGTTVAPRWMRGTAQNPTKINVFIQNDPMNANRHNLLKMGIDRWQARLDRRNAHIQIMVMFNATGKAPAGTVNPVEVTFEPAGTMIGEKKLKTTLGTSNAAAALPMVPTNAQGKATSPFFNGGKIIVLNTAVKDPTQANTVKNIGEHEFSHMLGFGHDNRNGVTNNHTQSNQDRDPFQDLPARHPFAEGMSPTDRREFNTLYNESLVLETRGLIGGPLNTSAQAAPQTTFALKSMNAEGTEFTYEVMFSPILGDPVIPVGDQHIPYLVFGIDPLLLDDVMLPDGWLLQPNAEPDPADPYYFLDGYLTDMGLPVGLQVHGDGQPMRYLALRASDDLAAMQGFMGEAALSAARPSLEFTFKTVDGAAVGTIGAAGADGFVQRLTGPVRVVPEPGSAGLALLIVAGIAVRRRRVA